MMIDQVIASSIMEGLAPFVTACAALATAYATRATVQEMKKQRAATYHPELVVSKKSFVGIGSLKENRVPLNWIPRNDIGEVIEKTENFFGVPLCNVGLAAAKEIKASWSLPIDELVALINDKAQQTMTPPDITITFETETLRIKSESFKDIVSFPIDCSETIDYALPLSIQPDPIMLKLPESYIYLTSLLIFLTYKEYAKDIKNAKSETPDMTIPEIKLQLEYYDIASTKHNSSFTLEFHLLFLSEEFRASLDPKKITA
jgi:hypothetical protein